MSEERKEIAQSYAEFLDRVAGKIADTLPENKEYRATPQEEKWWKGYEVRRAIINSRHGNPTDVDYRLIRRKTNIIPSAATKRRIRGKI